MSIKITVREVQDDDFCILCGWGDTVTRNVAVVIDGLPKAVTLCRRHDTPEKFYKQYKKQGNKLYKQILEQDGSIPNPQG
jgi:hypothetical protein